MFAEISLLNKLFKSNDFVQIKARILEISQNFDSDGQNNNFTCIKEYNKLE